LRMPFGVEVPFVPVKAEVWLTIETTPQAKGCRENG
jgi:hypothetical protein